MHLKIIPHIVEEPLPEGAGKLCQLPGESTAFEAARQMFECNVAAIAITDEAGELHGIVTERDLTRRVLGQGLDPRKTPLTEIMTRKPDTLSPDDTALSALELMRERAYRHLPVIDDDGRVVAMVSIRNLYAAVKAALEDDVRETEAFVFGDRYGA